MKRTLSVLVLLALLLALALPAGAAYEDGFVIDENGVLTKYTGSGGEVTIPAGVTAIGDNVFYGNEKLTGVTFPAGLTSIGEYAFYRCKNLTHAALPEGLTHVGFRAFFECGSLTNIVIPRSLTVVGNEAFSGCNKVTSLTIPEGVTSIGDFTFSGCRSLPEVTIPSTVQHLGYGAFYYCKALERVTLPEDLTDFGGSVFGETPWQLAMGDFPVVNGVLLEYQGHAADVKIPEGPTAIGENAFARNTDLRSVTIPQSVTAIGDWAFNKCEKLDSVTVLGSLKSVGKYAFEGTAWLTSQREFAVAGDYLVAYVGAGGDVTVPEGVKTVGTRAFYMNKTVTSVTLPSTVTVIGDEAFFFCTGLTTVRASRGLQDVGVDAFAYCTSLSEAFFPAAERSAVPAESTNLMRSRYVEHYDSRYGDTVDSCLYWDGEGYVRAESVNGLPVVERYSSDFKLLSARSLESNVGGPWGGFFIGEEYNFTVYGQNNPKEDGSVPVVTVTKYSKQWEKLGQASLYGANTIKPFEAGSLRCAEVGDMLYVHTCHQMYRSSRDGLNHQANMTFALRQSDMTITDAQYEVSSGYGYASHSFDQFILADREGELITMDLGDAYPRCLRLLKYKAAAGNETFAGKSDSFELLHIPGKSGDNVTGISAGGLGETEKGIVAVWNYNGVGGSEELYPIRNVYFSWTDKGDFSEGGTKIRQLTSFPAEGDQSAGIPVLAPTGLEGGYILWEVVQVDRAGDCVAEGSPVSVAWVKYDRDGNVGEIHTAPGALSDCPPIFVNGKLMWYVTEDSLPLFYLLDDSGLKTQTVTWPEPIKVSVEGKQVLWKDAEPFIDANNRTMVPLRAVAEALGLTVSWDSQAREAGFSDGKRTLFFPIGSSEARTGEGGTVVMDTAAVIVNSRTYAPIRYLAEFFGYKVDWDGKKKTVLLTKD